MKTEFITYKTLPDHLKETRDKAFAHSVLTPEAQAMDELGEYTALYMGGKFIGAVNTLKNQKPLELWSGNAIVIDEPYAFFCRGFIGEGVRLGAGAHILLSLSLKVCEKGNFTFFTSTRPIYRGINNLLINCGYTLQHEFSSMHQKQKTVDLRCYQFSGTSAFAKEKMGQLLLHIESNCFYNIENRIK